VGRPDADRPERLAEGDAYRRVRRVAEAAAELSLRLSPQHIAPVPTSAHAVPPADANGTREGVIPAAGAVAGGA